MCRFSLSHDIVSGSDITPIIWASSRQNLSSGFPTKSDQNQTPQLQRLARKLKGDLAWYGKITWESAHAWILKILCDFIDWGITLIF